MILETVCAGVNAYVVCTPVYGVQLDKEKVKIPVEYMDWTVEKAVFSPEDDKIYIQLSYRNLRKVITS